MERRTIRFLIVSALACFGFVFAMGTAQAQEGETTVQGTQNSTGAAANTGVAAGANVSSFDAGPSASGDANASSQQLGSNSGAVSQDAEAKSGDPVAGGQVTGCVCDNATVQNSNTSVGSVATAGVAVAANVETSNVGPNAASNGPASTAQSGNNTMDVAQSNSAETGDAVAGSQVTGIVGSGVHTIQNSNFSTGGFAFTGVALGVNFSTTAVGPTAVSTGAAAQTGQLGDNDATLSQASEVITGDALAGAQVSGIVGGSATVQNTNNAPANVAVSGFGFAFNIALPANVGPAAIGPTVAQASQTGDNSVDVAQAVTGETGDAVAGSQVTGAVGDQGGFLVVQNQQASTGDVAFSGILVAANIGATTAGPAALSVGVASAAQNGDNDVVFAQAIEAETGDALAGSQVTGAVGHSDVTVQNSNVSTANVAVSGIAVTANAALAATGPKALAVGIASTSQLGDNSLALDQAIAVETGDAVAGGQITGVVAAGSTVTIQNSNVAIGNFAFSGFAIAANVDLTFTGPVAVAALAAQTSQTGDNSAARSQAIEAETGDAVAGGQISGVVAGAGSEVTVQNQQFAAANIGISGFIVALNTDLGTFVGPLAAAAGVATVSQLGDNSLASAQALEASSGDAVAGSQITGIVAGAGSEATIQNSNTSLGNFTFSGPVIGVNLLGTLGFGLGVGPNAIAGLFASASQVGDNSLAFAQDLAGESGDAVSGSQVNGIVGTTDATVQVQQNSIASIGTSGFVGGLNAATGTLTATANALGQGGIASATQAGDTAFAGSQELSSETGDGLGGAQITGEVGASLAGVGAGL